MRPNPLIFLVVGFSWILSFSIYVYTVAPHVTLLDSGELILAAQHLGVPHPSGYPLWTISAWAWTHALFFLPGSTAWKVNLFSGFCGASAVATLAWIVSQSIDSFLPHWLPQKFKNRPFEEKERSWLLWERAFGPIIGLTFALLFAVSAPMWSQCVIAEVYSLHAWIIMTWAAMLLKWAQGPERDRWLILSYFFYALGLSNHHLTLTLTPVPLLLVALVRPRLLPELIICLGLIAALCLSFFSWLSDDPATPFVDYPFLWPTALRFLGCVVLGLAIWLVIRCRLDHWRLGAMLLLVFTMGLLPYAYMPLAASTNPPMNWGNAQTRAGFFYSINRSQYHGSLTRHIDRTLGRLMGTSAPGSSNEESPPSGWPDGVSRTQSFILFCGMYWGKIRESFTLLAILFFFLSFLSILRLRRNARAWVFAILAAFLLAAFLEPFFGRPTIDCAGWVGQMPYHAYSFAFFTIAAAFGFGWCVFQLTMKFCLQAQPSEVIAMHRSFLGWSMALAGLSLVAAGWMQNASSCSQRGHDFGWIFGYEMLKELPQGSVLFGGTDSGRFVPTYLILGKGGSSSIDRNKQKWNRRDLYIITQNALGDRFYIDGTRDQYGENRPAADSWLMRALGRKQAYPHEPLKLPTDEELGLIVEKLRAQKLAVDQDPTIAQAAIAEWIFLHNRDQHAFFVEESFPMLWSYPYAVPHGFCYEIRPEPVARLSPQVVEQDRVFWLQWTQRLLSNPRFQADIDAQRSFSKLRLTTARIYHFRGMHAEAEEALRQSLALSPINIEALSLFSSILTEQGRFEEPIRQTQSALKLDPYNFALYEILQVTQQRKELDASCHSLEDAYKQDPKNARTALALIEILASLGKAQEADVLATRLAQQDAHEESIYPNLISYYLQTSRPELALKTAETWRNVLPQSIDAKRALVRLYWLCSRPKDSLQAAAACIRQGGFAEKLLIASDPLLEEARQQGLFKDILE